jgi:hypothetical protein
LYFLVLVLLGFVM